MRAPSAVMSRNSAPGIVAARRLLSSGVRTQKAVASAPASAGRGAITVALSMWLVDSPVRGSTMWE